MLVSYSDEKEEHGEGERIAWVVSGAMWLLEGKGEGLGARTLATCRMPTAHVSLYFLPLLVKL